MIQLLQILVTHVVDASNFYARILEYRNTEASDAVAMPTTHLDLAFDLALWFSDPNHKEACSSHMAGDLCVIEDGQHVYHRVRVQRSKRTGSSMFEEEKEVGQCFLIFFILIKLTLAHEKRVFMNSNNLHKFYDSFINICIPNPSVSSLPVRFSVTGQRDQGRTSWLCLPANSALTINHDSSLMCKRRISALAL